jgi:hypothetical protein
MRGVLGAVAAVALLAAVLSPLSPEAGAASTVAINVVTAADHGCSPDTWTSPDLRVTVLVDGDQVLQTDKAQDESNPLYARLATLPAPSSPVQVSIQVEEAEPSGFLGLGTSWVPCDTDPGPGPTYTFSWDGGARTVVARGDAGNAAEATVVFGPGGPTEPKVAVDSEHGTLATVSWDAAPGLQHRLAWGSVGDVFATVPAGTSSHVMTGLCDDTGYVVRVVRDQEPWHAGSRDVPFRTANEAPSPPRILEARPVNGSIQLRVALPTSHDLARLRVFGADTSDVPFAGTPMLDDGSGPWSSWSGSVPDSPAYVRVVVTDRGGLLAASDAFRVGSAAASSDQVADPCPLGMGGLPAGDGPESESRPTSIAVPPQHGDNGPSAFQDPDTKPPLGFLVVAGLVVAVLLGVLVGLALRSRR